MVHREKIFAIGLGKTGTTSLKNALQILGFSTLSVPVERFTVEDVKNFDSALDGCIADRFEELDTIFPGSKFIYTVREMESWLKSIERFLLFKKDSIQKRPQLRKLLENLYGSIEFDKNTYRNAYLEHQDRVLSYFENRTEDLLIVEICNEITWDPLCNFLRLPTPRKKFPDANQFGPFDKLLIQLIRTVDDVEVIVSLTSVSKDYLTDLRNRSMLENDDLQWSLSFDHDRRIDKVLRHCCQYFGGPTEAARRLKLSELHLQEVMRRYKRRKTARKIRKILPWRNFS